jgi:hypothetical protein
MRFRRPASTPAPIAFPKTPPSGGVFRSGTDDPAEAILAIIDSDAEAAEPFDAGSGRHAGSEAVEGETELATFQPAARSFHFIAQSWKNF